MEEAFRLHADKTAYSFMGQDFSYAEVDRLSRQLAAYLQGLGLAPGSRFILVVFHPVVQQAAEARRQALDLAAALADAGLPLVWLEPNADAGALGVLQALDLNVAPGEFDVWSHKQMSKVVSHTPVEQGIKANAFCVCAHACCSQSSHQCRVFDKFLHGFSPG